MELPESDVRGVEPVGDQRRPARPHGPAVEQVARLCRRLAAVVLDQAVALVLAARLFIFHFIYFLFYLFIFILFYFFLWGG